jgi:hypothetical protein
MFKVAFVGLIKTHIYYVLKEEKIVTEAVLIGEACVSPHVPLTPV